MRRRRHRLLHRKHLRRWCELDLVAFAHVQLPLATSLLLLSLLLTTSLRCRPARSRPLWSQSFSLLSSPLQLKMTLKAGDKVPAGVLECVCPLTSLSRPSS